MILLPTMGDEIPGIPSIILEHPLPARNALGRAIATKLNLTEQLPAIVTAPEKARLIVDTRRGAIWFGRIEVPDLKPGTHQFLFTELLARNAPGAVSKEELVKHLSYGRTDGDQGGAIRQTEGEESDRGGP